MAGGEHFPAFRRLASQAPDRRRHDGGEHPDNRDDSEQLDKGESAAGAPRSARESVSCIWRKGVADVFHPATLAKFASQMLTGPCVLFAEPCDPPAVARAAGAPASRAF